MPCIYLFQLQAKPQKFRQIKKKKTFADEKINKTLKPTFLT